MSEAIHPARPKTLQPLLQAALLVGVLTTFLALALYAYLGSFSRYGSDDYCLSAFYLQKGSFWSLMLDRYSHSSSRYTNILFIGLVDQIFGWYNVAILPPLMLALFVFGFYWLLREIVQWTSLGWSRLTTLLLAGLIVYFAVSQAPNLYETLYWRAGMTSHFAPLVCLTFLGAFLLHQIRLVRERALPVWALVVGFLASFLIGGFSEPPVALMITILVLGMGIVWLWGDRQFRRPTVAILSWSLAGFFLALAVLMFAPANAIRLEKAPPGLLELIIKTFQYPSVFLVDVFRSFPLPALVSLLLPLTLFWAIYSLPAQSLPRWSHMQIVFLLVGAFLLAYLLIAATFAPSVYGQSYPVARARFAAVVILTCLLMTSGALLSLWLARISRSAAPSKTLPVVAVLALFILCIYPLRTASRLSQDIPVYRDRAAAWDQRDAQIRALQATGVRDVVVPFLSAEISQDLGDRTGFRLNRCASTLYNVDTIRARPVDSN